MRYISLRRTYEPAQPAPDLPPAVHVDATRADLCGATVHDCLSYGWPTSGRVRVDGEDCDIYAGQCSDCRSDFIAVRRPGRPLPARYRCRDCQATVNRRKATERRRRLRAVPLGQMPRQCHHCGETFTPKRSTARFCSTRCRVAAHRAG